MFRIGTLRPDLDPFHIHWDVFFNFESSLLVSSVPRRWWVTAMERIIMGNYQITSLRYQPRSCNLDGASNVQKEKIIFFLMLTK